MKLQHKKKAFTFIEVCMSVLIFSLIMGVGTGIVSYSRRETEKGFWIQGGITQLRNATRQISIKMKEFSYPATMITDSVSKGDNATMIIPFKEKREYDRTGRLRYLEVSKSKAYEVYADISSSQISPDKEQRLLMCFPSCVPEKDYENSYTPGKIIWTRFVLEPSKNYDLFKTGSIFMEEYEGSYDTRRSSSRAFSLDEPFDMQTTTLLRRREIVKDVELVSLKAYKISGSRGSYVTQSGTKSSDFEQIKNILTFKITCAHPKDKKIRLSDMCSVTVNAEVLPF